MMREIARGGGLGDDHVPQTTMVVTLGARPAWGRVWPAGLAWALWVLTMLCLVVIAWLDHLLRRAGRPDLVQLGGGAVVAPVLAAVSASTVGAILASRRPRHPVGWLLLALGLSLNGSGVAAAYTNYGLLARPGALVAARSVALYLPAMIVTALACLGFILLLTPTGSLPSTRWRWWARAAAAAPVLGVLVITLSSQPLDQPYQAPESPLDLRGLGGALLVVYQLAFGVTNLAVVVAAGSLVVRFRSARGTERQQLRWVALAAALVSGAAVVVVAGVVTGAAALVSWVAGICVAILPLAIGAAVLRYRLYDLDRIISRTLTYGLLTVLLGGAYAGVVMFGGLLGGVQSGGGRSDPGGGSGVPAGPAPRPAAGGPTLQPPPLRRRTDDRGVQRPAARAGRLGHADDRTLGGCGTDDAAVPDVTVAAATASTGTDGQCRRSPTTKLRTQPRTTTGVALLALLFEVVADYRRVSAVHMADRTGNQQASEPQYAGLTIGWIAILGGSCQNAPFE